MNEWGKMDHDEGRERKGRKYRINLGGPPKKGN
jgi:hypothetical protein